MPKTLLLADDSVTIQKVVGISFANEDVRLITVDNGDAAIARARQERPDLILADVVMPGKSGYEVCEAVKADPSLRHIPVLLLTGTFEAFDEARAARVGAAGHIAKPFESQVLVEQVKRLMAQSEAQRSSAPRAPATPVPPAPPRPAPSAARVAPAVSAASPEAGESFEFFSDEPGEPIAPAASGPSESADAFALDENDSAFAFGDSEISALESEPPPAAPPRVSAPVPGERTIAILPDEEPAAPRSIPVDRFADLAVGPQADEFAPLDPPGGAGSDAFEFEFDSAAPSAGRDRSLRVDSDDLAQATVLDPHGASGFDVSSSDLGDPLAEPEPAPMTPRGTPPARRAPAPESFEPVVSAEDSFAGLSAEIGEDAELAPATAVDDIDDFEELDESSLEVLAPPRPAAPPPRSAAAERRPEPTHAAASALEALTPKLRAQLHDTLEKIAWESFSTVTEQIVRQALERVEAIAWEVIPQMAETLVREEIRRLKGESD